MIQPISWPQLSQQTSHAICRWYNRNGHNYKWYAQHMPYPLWRHMNVLLIQCFTVLTILSRWGWWLFKIICNWFLNNTGLSCVGPLTCLFFSTNIVPVFSFYRSLNAESLHLIHGIKKLGFDSWFYPNCFSFLLLGSYLSNILFSSRAVLRFLTAWGAGTPQPLCCSRVNCISYQYLRTGRWWRKLDWRQCTQGKPLLHLANLFIVLCLI